jgi:hypothetical protein
LRPARAAQRVGPAWDIDWQRHDANFRTFPASRGVKT